MFGRDRDRRPEPQLECLGNAGLRGPALAFVGEDDHRPAATPQHRGERPVERHHPGTDIEDEQHGVGLLHRCCRLPLHPRRQHIAAGILEAGRIDHPEGKVTEPGEAFPAVARHARGIVDDRSPAPHQPVEQRRFADVGAADDGQHRTSCLVTTTLPASRTRHCRLSGRQTARRRRRANRWCRRL